jgi:uncharacterized protein (DUF58 family)
MRLTAQRHDVVPVVITDPMEDALPSVGIVNFEDIETGSVIEFDTSGAGAAMYRKKIDALADARDAALRRMSLDVVEVHTDRPYVDALVAFFKARARRLAHG